jgi:hypothetical protein
MYINDTGAISATEQPGYLPVIADEKPTVEAWERVVKGALIRHEDHYQQTWQILAADKYTAGEWLEHVGLGSDQQPTLIYLKLQLQAAGKSSAKLTALEGYMNQILGQFAMDNTPRTDWPQPPYGYQETVGECVMALQS